MRKISELLRLKYEVKLPHRAIAHSLGISASTVSGYVKRAVAAGICWPLPAELTEEQLHQMLFAVPSGSCLQPNWTAIHQDIRRKGVTLRLLWEEYSSEQPNGFSYSQFCRAYQPHKQLEPVMRFTHHAGENCFVDYAGLTMAWVNPITGQGFKAHIFVGCLGASNYTYIEASASQTLRDGLTAHANMFDYFGGVPQNGITDNLKAAVTKAHRYDPDINLTYPHFAEYYGVAILPARAAKPRDKAKVENAVLCIERHILAPLRHRTFTSLAAINDVLKDALTVFNTKPFQKLPGSRLSFFQTLDKPALKPLPALRYEWAEWRRAKVHLDYHIIYDKHGYSVPYRFIGQTLNIRATTHTLDCYHNLLRVAHHPRLYRPGYTTLAAHMPAAHQQASDISMRLLLDKAKSIGTHTQSYLEVLMTQRAFPQQAYRPCLGILRLGQRFGAQRLEQACQRALFHGLYRYRDIQTLLQKGLDSAPLSEALTQRLPLHDNLRGAAYYA